MRATLAIMELLVIPSYFLVLRRLVNSLNPDLEARMSPEITQVLRLVSQDWPVDAWKDINVAVALSGGADSIALVRILNLLKESVGGTGKIFAFHVNHHLRGEESEHDASWCRDQCQKLGIECAVLDCDPSARATKEGDGFEAAARTERYTLMTQEAERRGVRYLATAHTQDDQVETILFRLLRGSGLRGLSGIPKSRALSPAVTVVRPLLSCSRAKLEEMLQSLGQTWRTDSTNQEHRFTRNRLRHELLPKLRADYNSNLDAILLQLAAQSSEASQVIDQLAEHLLEQSSVEISSAENNLLAIELASTADVLPAVLVAAIRKMWREVGLSEQDMTYQWWQQIAELLLTAESEQILNLPGNVRASIVRGKLRLEW